MFCIFEFGFSMFTLIPRCFIQSNPSNGFVLFVVISNSSFFFSPYFSMLAIVFSSNLILLLFTSRYSSFNGYFIVVPLNFCFGIRVTGDPLSIMNLIGRLLTNTVTVKNGCPSLYICLVEWTVLFIECILLGVQLSCSALVASESC